MRVELYRAMRPVRWLTLTVTLGLLLGCQPAAAPAKPSESKPAEAPKASAPGGPAAPAPAAPAPAQAPAAPAASPAAAAKPTAPAAQPAAAAKPTKEKWVVATGEETDTLDPTFGASFGADILAEQFFDTLIGIEGPDLKPAGRIAERWENPNPTTWRFHIRKGVKAHDGEEINAEDVKYSFDLALDPKVKRYAYVSAIKSVNIVDPLTVDIVTAEPNSAMLVNVNRVYIMPKDAREKMGADAYAKKPVGTGAYKVLNWQPGQHLELQSADTWWRGKAQPNLLTVRFIKDPATRVAELKSGGVDIISNPPVPELKSLSGGDTELIPAKGGRTIINLFNPKKKPFDDVRVRQAVNFAVDREGIVKSVLEGNGLVLTGPFAPGWLGFDPSDKPWPYDPKKAKELLTQAGYPNGLETTWNISSGVFLKDREIAEAVAGQLAEVGIKVSLVPTERAKLQQDAQNGTFDGIIAGAWGANYDPDAMLGYYYVGNKPAFLNDTITKFINQGRSEVDAGKRQQIYQQLGDYHVENALWLYIHAQDELWAKRKDVPWQLFNTQGSKAYVYYFMVPRAS